MKTAEEIWMEKDRKLITISAETTICDALKIMVENRIGAMLITKEDKIVGIWTERDLMKDMMTEGFNPKTARIGDYMSTNLRTVPGTASVYHMLDKYLGMRIRHLIVEKEGNYIGMLSMGDVIRASLLEKSKELEDLNAITSWEYYEDWKWKTKK